MIVESKPEFLSKGPILGIFAHPDDESFAAGGFFSVASKWGCPVFIFTLTSGESGVNYSGILSQNLGAEREKELRDACKVMGISSNSIFLGHLPDGRLTESQEDAHRLILEAISQIKPAIVVAIHPDSTTHPDHKIIGEFLIQLKDNPDVRFSLYLQFLPGKYNLSINQQVITLRLDQEFFKRKREAISQHRSQQPDIARILPELLQEEHFIIFG